MSRIGLSLPMVFLMSIPGNTMAQPGSWGTGRSNMPAVGSMLPHVTVYDDQGNEFSTKSLRGHYSVLVTGCLT